LYFVCFIRYFLLSLHREINYTAKMKIDDLKYGMQLVGKDGDLFEIADSPGFRVKGRRGYVLLHFLETDNYQFEYTTKIPKETIDLGKPFMYGIGYMSSTRKDPAERAPLGSEYIRWQRMLERCYDKGGKTYKDVTVCDEWHDFKKFQKWYDKVCRTKDIRWSLDKDLFSDDVRVYSPETCVLIPKQVNLLLLDKRYLVEYKFDKEYLARAYKLRLLLDKHKRDVRRKVYNRLDDLLSNYEYEYKRVHGKDLKEVFENSVKLIKADLTKETCICMLRYKGNMYYFSNLKEIKNWLKEKTTELNRADIFTGEQEI